MRLFFPFFSILMTISDAEAKDMWFLSIVAHFSLFPLLFNSNLDLIKISLFLTYTLIVTNSLKGLWPSIVYIRDLPIYELLYTIGFIGIIFYEFSLQYLLKFDKRLPFLPLMLTSVYCSLGIIYFWLKYYVKFLFVSNVPDSKVSKSKVR